MPSFSNRLASIQSIFGLSLTCIPYVDVQSIMLWRHVKEFDEAVNDKERLEAAGFLISALKATPLIIHFKGDGFGQLYTGSIGVVSRGRQIGLIQRLTMEIDCKTQNVDVEVTLPFNDTDDELTVRRVMEEGYETALASRKYAKILREAGVTVKQVPFP